MRFLDLSPVGDPRFYAAVLLALGLFAALSVRNSPTAVRSKATRAWVTWIACAGALFGADYAAYRLDAPDVVYAATVIPGIIALCVTALVMTRKWRSEPGDD
ncbi:hypothetical protein HN371_24655 [Candidatus Poribacteria bacterium]|jgi:hypothetical protein|nr:hypothetical protein [Candidatus Poribacteria bacterium]MBT5532781.1 hypothetical protein [Candidatus Poribacteria bacterium]MBT5712785.1 hypothetical protein [Candidatus Poribacteria bacterium]MBT7096480.1 hypothetical protein [Candidatus Poribacteria bacterium]MBT7807196.1 hypothetical protein [Candidatus Poribacteria bacterium]